MNIKSVLSLLTEKDMNAADMTHKLSEAGCGDMQNGIVTVARLSLFAGIFIGSGISLAIEARKKAKELIAQTKTTLSKEETQEPLSDSQVDDLKSTNHFLQDQSQTFQTGETTRKTQ